MTNPPSASPAMPLSDERLANVAIVQPEVCAACGQTFEPMESRYSWWAPAHWVVRQQLGPIHARCRRWSEAQEDALSKTLNAIGRSRDDVR